MRSEPRRWRTLSSRPSTALLKALLFHSGRDDGTDGNRPEIRHRYIHSMGGEDL